MDFTFWLKVALSFAVGGGWVAMTTAAAERYGSKVGGLIGGLPSTVLVSLLFIGITQGAGAAASATTLMPLAQGINGLFVLSYLLLVPHGAAAGFAGALAVWLALSGALAATGSVPFSASLAGWALLLVVCCLAAARGIPSRPGGRSGLTRSPVQLGVRAVFGGTIIAAAVVIARLLGPAIGGIFAAFPAMFLATLVSTYRSGGVAFSQAVGKSMMVSGLVNVVVYVVAVRYLYAHVGLAAGTAFALILTAAAAWLTFALAKTR